MSDPIALRDSPGTIAKRETRTPEELIAEGERQAKALMRVVNQAGLARNLGGKKDHLEVEAWQTITNFNGYFMDIVWTRPVVEGGQKVGYEARAELVSKDTAEHFIGAEACCFFDEELERADGTSFKRWDDDYAVRSMSQTRAQSKLGRMAFAWVVVLAGYSGTPADEMEGVRRREGRKITFPFPDEIKGKSPSECDLATLMRMLPIFEKAASDPKNKYRDRNEQLVTAIKSAIAEKTAKPESPAGDSSGSSLSQPDVPVDGELPSSPAGDENPAVEDWKRELREAESIEKLAALWKSLQKKEVWPNFQPTEQGAMEATKDKRKGELQKAASVEQGKLL